MESKNIYVGETRILTKRNVEGNSNVQYELRNQFYYHGDHLGSAQLITQWQGNAYERIEYTPYGEEWIEWQGRDHDFSTPFRFTGKERDEETGLYYYGARYLDPKTSRWMSADPAMGDYVPGAPVNDEARKRNQNLPGMGGVFNVVNMHTYHYAGNNPIKYTDLDGKVLNLAAAGIGAVIGAGLRAIAAIAAGGSGRDIAAAAAGGAVTCGMAGLTMGGSLAVQIAAGSLSATAGYMASNIVAGKEHTVEGTLMSAAGGAAGVMTGAILNKLISVASVP